MKYDKQSKEKESGNINYDIKFFLRGNHRYLLWVSVKDNWNKIHYKCALNACAVYMYQ